MMFGTLGWQELLLILVILALLFGATRVASLGGALGRGIREFRKEARGEDDEDTGEPREQTREQPREQPRDETVARSEEPARRDG